MNLDTATPRIVGIHGAPRSGTSWLGQIFNSHPGVAYRYQPFFSYAFRGKVTQESSPTDFEKFFEDLLVTDDDFVMQSGPQRLSQSAPEFTKTGISHLVYKEVRFHDLIESILRGLPGARAVGIVRDPRAMLASWFDAPREFDPAWDPRREWKSARAKNEGKAENWYGFDRWKELTRWFLELQENYPRRFRIVRYIDLVSHPVAETRKLFDFVGLNVTRQTEEFLVKSMSSDDQDPYGVYRNSRKIVGRWRDRLDRSIADAVTADLSGTPLKKFLVE